MRHPIYIYIYTNICIYIHKKDFKRLILEAETNIKGIEKCQLRQISCRHFALFNINMENLTLK